MKTTMKKVGLFGGVLCAAGVVQTASAGATWSTTNPYAGSFTSMFEFVSPYGFEFLQSYGIPSDAYTTAVGAITGSAHAYATSTMMSATVNRTDSGGGYVGSMGANIAISYLSVSSTTDVLITWDFDNLGVYDVIAYVHDNANTTTYFSSVAGTSGSTVITLVSGQEYNINFSVSAGNASPASGFITAQIIPAPGAVALLGLGGIVARRKRRGN